MLKIDNFRKINEKTMKLILNGKKGSEIHITNRHPESLVQTPGWEPGPIMKKDMI
jgi:hypothetical protein